MNWKTKQGSLFWLRGTLLSVLVLGCDPSSDLAAEPSAAVVAADPAPPASSAPSVPSVPSAPDEDPGMVFPGFPTADFKTPVDRCRWPAMGSMPPARDVIMTPLVLDLDLDRKPEIVFAPQNGIGPARLVAIHGNDCSQVYDVAANLEGFAQLAAADLDGDKYPELVGLLYDGLFSTGHVVAVFDGRTGTKLAQSTDSVPMKSVSFDGSGPAIADLDGDGTPEIIVGAMVVRWNKRTKTLDTVWKQTVDGSNWGTVSLADDFDGDGRPEVVVGNRIFDGVSGAEKTPSVMATLTIAGYAAVGDFNADRAPDLVFVQSQNGNQKVAVIDVKRNAFLLGPTAIPGGWGGPPTVADFDGDGKPEFVVAASHVLTAFSLDCLKMPKPKKCLGKQPGALWESAIKDVSSGGTAAVAFDLNGDGRSEVVYRDECWLRGYNGADGKILFARSITSGTALELPVIADVNGDRAADLVVASDSIQGPSYCADQNPEPTTGQPHLGVTQGIFVLKDPMNRWSPARRLWNQHSYHITNINDDFSIPRREPPNWTRYNNYRENSR